MLITQKSYSPSNSRGFLVLEGVNGAGKSTILKKLDEYVQSTGRKVTVTREPGATPLGVELRGLLLEGRAGKPAPIAEILLFGADRADHVSKIIKPALSLKSVVLSDRYFYSTIAFQGYGRDLDKSKIDFVNKIAIDGITPDLVILLDLDASEGLKRTKKREAGKDKASDTFEAEAISFHNKIRDGFLEIAKNSSEPFLVIDASKSADAIFSELQPTIDRWLSSLSV